MTIDLLVFPPIFGTVQGMIVENALSMQALVHAPMRRLQGYPELFVARRLRTGRQGIHIRHGALDFRQDRRGVRLREQLAAADADLHRAGMGGDVPLLAAIAPPHPERNPARCGDRQFTTTLSRQGLVEIDLIGDHAADDHLDLVDGQAHGFHFPGCVDRAASAG